MKDLDDKFVEMYKKLGASYGAHDIFLTLFARLYLEPEAIALDQLAKITGYSLATISNNVKILQQMGLVTKTRKPGSKKIYVYMEKDLTNLVKHVLLMKQQVLFKGILEQLPEIIKEYRKGAKTEKQKKKLKIIEDYYKQIEGMEKLTQKFIEAIDNMKK